MGINFFLVSKDALNHLLVRVVESYVLQKATFFQGLFSFSLGIHPLDVHVNSNRVHFVIFVCNNCCCLSVDCMFKITREIRQVQ